jgi:sugar transferase (PEP-CTERM/EpsH1 system associated)
MKILFITSRFPFPPIKGDKVVAYNRLKYFSRKHDITLLTFADASDMQYVQEVSKYCKEIHCVPFSRLQAWTRLFLQGYKNVPMQVLYYQSREFRRTLDALLKFNAYDLIHVFLLRMAPYVSALTGCPKILELIDSMELNMEKRASLERGIKKWIFAEEARRLSRYERWMTGHYDHSVVVSGLDKRTISGARMEVVPNGVNTDEFYPAHVQRKDGDVVIFTGNMSYFPNETAVIYFADTIFPKIQAQRPGVQFRIVGGGASQKVRNLAKNNKAISVLGFVDSMADHINRVKVSVCPLIAGSPGMKLKILESLACGVPVVATSIGKGDSELGEEDGLYAADDPDKFAEKVLHLLSNNDDQNVISQKISNAVKNKYSWEASNLRIEKIYSELVK